MGNPSDGFHGKTISMSIENFWAEVTIKESEKLVSFVSFKSRMHSCNAQLSNVFRWALCRTWSSDLPTLTFKIWHFVNTRNE